MAKKESMFPAPAVAVPTQTEATGPVKRWKVELFGLAGSLVVEARDEAEAWEKFKAEAKLRQTDNVPKITEVPGAAQ